jgi:cytochrome c553
MKRLSSVLWSLLVCGAVSTAWLSHPVAAAGPTAAPTASSDNGALFTAFVPVLRHPRCMNCHSKGGYPRQGDDSHRHTMDIRRGPAGFGVTSVKCSTCHQDHNLGAAHLPPMIWEGLTDGQLCESIKNPKQNRGRNIDQLVEHLTEDKLVMWGWNPGEGRTPVPIPHDEFSAKVKAWQAAGAPCPAR